MNPLPLQSTIDQYRQQAAALDPSFNLPGWYHFEDWPGLANFAQAAADENSPVFQFESAADAIVAGDTAALTSAISKNPDLVHARSTRIHRGTLLHYIAANGVEQYRQKTPPNAVEIATILLKNGAPVDATANMYGAPSTTMAMLVSSVHPAQAGVQVPLVETLLDFGASPDQLITALAFGYLPAAETLARRGARLDSLAAAAGLGQLAQTRDLLPLASAESRRQALALSAQHGHADVVRLLLDAGADPNQFNPPGMHAHSTPFHQAAVAGHDAVVRLLIERGARTDVEDKIHHATPLGWAIYGHQSEIENYLNSLE